MQHVPARYQGDPGSALPPHAIRKGGQGAGKGRENRSGANSHRAGDSAPASRAPPPRLALPGLVRLYSRVAWIARPKATCPPAAPPPRAWPRRSRALGPGRSPFRPAPVTQHPSSLRPRIPRPRSCAPGTGSQPGAQSPAGGVARGRGLRWAGAVADLSLLLLPGRVQEQVSIPVLFGLHVVIGLLGIIMVHDGERVLGAGFLPPPSLPVAAAAACCPGVGRESGMG